MDRKSWRDDMNNRAKDTSEEAVIPVKKGRRDRAGG